MDNQEKIVSPAVSCEFEHWEMCDKFKQIIMCVHYDDGIVNDIKNAFIDENTDFISSADGFMTSKGRFVDPVEAQQIAIACGQYKDPHVRIKSLEKSIEVGWDSVKYAKTSVMITSLKKQIAEDQTTLEALKTGYLGNALRVEDLHYVKP